MGDLAKVEEILQVDVLKTKTHPVYFFFLEFLFMAK